jgi:hypothetical protein
MSTLRKGFVNAWLLAKDLDGIAARSKDADIARLCKLIKDNYGYPVDSVLITSDLRVVGHLNVHEPRATEPGGYLAFLREGLAAAGGKAPGGIATGGGATGGEATGGGATGGEAVATQTRAAPAAGAARARGVSAVKLTPEEPTGSVLDVIQRRAFGKQSMSFFPIDATAFAGGGTIELTVRVGGADASGKFELCAAVAGGMSPVRTLEKVTRGETGKIVHEFTKGGLFGLAAMPGAGSAEGEANAFLATVTVRGR